MEDIILVTIDCWRDDAINKMPALQSRTADWTTTTVVTHAAATYGAFPPILASQYYPQAYDTEGNLIDVMTLGDVLREHGYTTGGFVASNPYLTRWKNSFDTFWNDGLATDGGTPASESVIQSLTRASQRSLNLARLRDKVPASDVFDRAADWWATTDTSRFLWLHLMDTHEPYLPTLSHASNPLTAHYYIQQLARNSITELDDGTVRGLKQLYDDCTKYLDRQLEAFDEFLDDDPIVVMTGDHGEAFKHGVVGHAQLYDETITVPYLTTLDHPVPHTVRHIDIPATIVDAVGLPTPDQWEGKPIDGEHRDSFSMNMSPALGKTLVSLRTDTHKIIRKYGLETEDEQTEYYNLTVDSDEQEPGTGAVETVRNALSDRLDEFLSRESIDWDALNCRSMSGESPIVEERLENLGYI